MTTLISWNWLHWRLIWIWLIGLAIVVLLLVLQTIGIGTAQPAYVSQIWQWFLFVSLPLTLVLIGSFFLFRRQRFRVARLFRPTLSLLMIAYLLLLIGRPIYAALGRPNAAAALSLFELPDWSAIVGQLVIFGWLAGAWYTRSTHYALRDLPTVVFAFANSGDDHLPLLKEESRMLLQCLGPLHDQGILELHREESSTLEELIDIFDRFDQRLAIFHYGGHATSNTLLTESGAAHAAGLSAHLAGQKENLVLVFLNGCSTLPQVNRLLELGIPAVIATSVPIADTRATEFAAWFYQALAGGRSLGKAFDFASASLQTKYQDLTSPEVIQYRGQHLETEDAGNVSPWGLYVSKKRKEVLEWRLYVGDVVS